jgi:hypothetical protein
MAAVSDASQSADVSYDDFSRYELIIEREPFGSPPPPRPKDAAPKPSAPPPVSFVKNLKLVAISDTRLGVKVGFLDVGQRPPKSYYLAVGQSEDGIEVLEADYDAEGALLRKGTQQDWLYMKSGPSGGSGSGGGATGASAAPPKNAAAASSVLSSGSRRNYYARRLERRKEILEERRKADEERQKKGAEELRKQLREYNLDLIRARGEKGPPLPIQLTPEEDEQLVQEGVLPPR